MFWISRCDASAEYLFLFDSNENFYINICQHGNIHLTTLDSNIITEEMLKELDWKIIDVVEYDNFSIDSKIAGRRIEMINNGVRTNGT